MYIHQYYTGGASFSADALQARQQALWLAQNAKLQKQKESLEAAIGSAEEAQKFRDDTVALLRSTAEDTVKQIQTLDFSGLFQRQVVNGRATRQVKSLELANQKLNENADKLMGWVNTIDQIFTKMNVDPQNQGILFKQEVAGLLSMRERLMALVEQMRSIVGKAGPDSAEARKMVTDTIGRIIGNAADAMGQVYEWGIGDVINALKSAASGPNIHFTGAESGTENFRTKTSDIQLTYEMIYPNLDPLGVSIKRTNVKSSARAIEIKAKTTNFINMMNASEMGGWLTEDFYNILANHGRTMYRLEDNGQGMGEPIPTAQYNFGDFGGLVKALHQGWLLAALAGELNNSDFAQYLVINGHVFSIMDLVSQVNNGIGIGRKQAVTAVSSGFEQGQAAVAQAHTAKFLSLLNHEDPAAAAQERSSYVENMINHISIIYKARINLAFAL